MRSDFTKSRVHGCIAAMHWLFATRLAAAICSMLALCAGPAVAAMAAAVQIAPVLADLFWHPEETYCRFVREDAPMPDPGKPETWRYVFVTDLVSDDLASTERGYIRLGGLLRELDFRWRRETEKGEVRRYRTFGTAPVTVDVDMHAGEGEKSKLGQTILVHYTGTIALTGRNLDVKIPFRGSCGNEPEKR